MSFEDRLKTLRPGKRILTIQSHVVSGYAGNKCSVFPLQLHGFEVDVINSVQFSNHTGYKNVRGQCLTKDDLAVLYDGLKLNNLTNYSHVVTGYVGKVDFLKQIKEIITDLKQRNPHLLYVCDPVLGDCGEYYTPKDLMPVYRDEIIHLADILTPNAFELSELTGIQIDNEKDCFDAINKLHNQYNVKCVVVSSGISNPDNEKVFYAYASTIKEDGCLEQYKFEINKIDLHCVGTGDVFVSLLITWLDTEKNDIQKAVCKTISSLQSILKRTRLECQDESMAVNREIKLIQSRYDILQPSIDVKWEKL
uniref:Pyridoxal kinase n=1 Tax=Rhabditophanes sp. KR3021 TaxID=114890 RepID=A0AC35THJ3_9BILA